MADNKTLELMDFFVEYIERRKAYEKAKVDGFARSVDNVPNSVPSVVDREKFKEFADGVHAELDEELSKAFGFNGSPRRLIETEAIINQAETVYRSMRAEALRTMSFSRRAAAAIGRRNGHVMPNGLIDKVIVDTIEKKITRGVNKQ